MVTEPPRDNPRRHRRLLFFVAVVCVSSLSLLNGASSPDDLLLPESIVDAAERHLVSRVGEEFFLAYLRLNPSGSRYVEPPEDETIPADTDRRYRLPYYSLVYRFRMPQHGFVDEEIHCHVCPDGAVLQCRAVPDCVGAPEECRFPIDEDQARQIAVAEGLAAGIEPWRFGFAWHEGHGTYIWSVSNAMERTPDRSTGEVVTIDANSGAVFPRTTWVSHD